jgi:hypothetical protein
MEIKKIHLMQWGDIEKTGVRLIADTDTGDNEDIGTPYGPDSIIWTAVQTFSVEEIQPFQLEI